MKKSRGCLDEQERAWRPALRESADVRFLPSLDADPFMAGHISFLVG